MVAQHFVVSMKKLLEYMLNLGIARSTIDNQLDQIKLFIRECGYLDDGLVDEFSDNTLPNMLKDEKLLDNMISFCTRNRTMLPQRRASLIKLANYIGKEGIAIKLNDNIRKMRLRKAEPKKFKKEIGIDEYLLLIQEAPLGISLVCKIMFEAGLRASAVINLTREQITTEGNQIKISVMDKGKMTYGFLTQQTSKDLADYFRIVSKGKRIFDFGYKKFENELKSESARILERSTGITSHQIRYCRAIYELNINRRTVVEVQNILHHRDLKSTFVYLEKSAGQSKSYVDDLENVISISKKTEPLLKSVPPPL